MQAALTCWHCGKTTCIEVQGPPQFAFEVAGWANDVGMLGVLDMKHRRSLVFCNRACADAETTRSGDFRVRAKGVRTDLPAASLVGPGELTNAHSGL